MWTPQARRLLFISLEYERGCFSGNGVYAQSQVYPFLFLTSAGRLRTMRMAVLPTVARGL